MSIEDHLRVVGTRREYRKRQLDAATATLKLAVIQGYRQGLSKNALARLSGLALGTVVRWLESVDDVQGNGQSR